MYDLAPRFPCQCKEDDDGPTSYFVTDLPCNTNKGPSYPFTSTCQRFQKEKESGTPSPAHYFPKYRKRRIVGGKSLQYTGKRISYDSKKKSSKIFDFNNFHESFTRTHFVFKQSTKITGKNISKNIRGKKSRCRPSSDEISDEQLHKIRYLDVSKPLPEYLKFPGEICKATKKYSRSKWSRYTSDRKSLEHVNDSPGPGTYESKSTFCSTDLGENSRQSIVSPVSRNQKRINDLKKRPVCMSFDDTQPCFIDATSVEELHFFDGTCDYLYKQVSHNKNPKGLWGNKERFDYKASDTPAPCEYNLSVECRFTRRIVKIVPFSSCLPRFKSTKITDLSPASYSQDYLTIKEKPDGGVIKAPFGSSAPRQFTECGEAHFDDIAEEESRDNFNRDYLNIVGLCPGSTCSTEESESFTSQPNVFDNVTDKSQYYQIIGTSLVIRDRVVEPEVEPDLRDVYAKYKGKKSHRKPVASEGFLSSTDRNSDWLVKNTLSRDVDWPRLKDLKITGGAVTMTSPSCKKSVLKQDIPGFYDIHPMYSSSVYKPTHNYRLKNDCKTEKRYKDPNKVKTILKCFIPKELLSLNI